MNLALRVVGRRADGYHLLDSVVVPIAVFDELTVRLQPAERSRVGVVLPTRRGEPGWRRRIWPRAPPARSCAEPASSRRSTIELDKRIPVGAGLGGGSSDAAAVLRALNAHDRSARQPSSSWPIWALDLGADVPFFLYGRPARMRGIGEIVASLDSALRDAPRRCLSRRWPGDQPRSTRRYDDSLTTSRPLSSIRGLTVGHVPLPEHSRQRP